MKKICLLAACALMCAMIRCEGSDNDKKQIDPLPPLDDNAKIIFLHHSTGGVIWDGGVPDWFAQYNADNAKNYEISEQAFPKSSPYGWQNYPYDYWNIWVDHAGTGEYQEEPTLEILTQLYHVVIFKHCFPVSGIQADSGAADISSQDKEIQNYKLQYDALREKMREFPDTRFIVWTGAALVSGASSADEGARARQFFEWVIDEWDEAGDNIYVWDFFELETEGGNFLKEAYAGSPDDSHPNGAFAQTAAPFFGRRIVDIIEGRGDSGSLTGK